MLHENRTAGKQGCGKAKKDTQTEQEQQTNGVAGNKDAATGKRTEQPRSDAAGKADTPKRQHAPDGNGSRE